MVCRGRPRPCCKRWWYPKACWGALGLDPQRVLELRDGEEHGDEALQAPTRAWLRLLSTIGVGRASSSSWSRDEPSDQQDCDARPAATAEVFKSGVVHAEQRVGRERLGDLLAVLMLLIFRRGSGERSGEQVERTLDARRPARAPQKVFRDAEVKCALDVVRPQCAAREVCVIGGHKRQ